MKKLLFLISMMLFSLSLAAQQKKTLYFLLKKDKYSKHKLVRPVKIKTQRIDTIYSFTLPCDCISSTINFFRSVNPETGRVNLPIRTIDRQEAKRLNFVKMDELVNIIQSHDDDFNRKYDLFLVEPGKKTILYHVFKMTSFGDYAQDRVGP